MAVRSVQERWKVEYSVAYREESEGVYSYSELQMYIAYCVRSVMLTVKICYLKRKAGRSDTCSMRLERAERVCCSRRFGSMANYILAEPADVAVMARGPLGVGR